MNAATGGALIVALMDGFSYAGERDSTMPKIHITVGTVDDKTYLRERAEGEGFVVWPVPKDARVGEDVLFLIPSRTGPICAVGSIVAKPVKSVNWSPKFETKIDKIVFLREPIKLKSLQEKFPDWGYVTNAKAQHTVPDEIADELKKIVKEAF